MENKSDEREVCFGMRSTLNKPPHCQVLKGNNNKCEGCHFYKPKSQYDAAKVDMEVMRYSLNHL